MIVLLNHMWAHALCWFGFTISVSSSAISLCTRYCSNTNPYLHKITCQKKWGGHSFRNRISKDSCVNTASPYPHVTQSAWPVSVQVSYCEGDLFILGASTSTSNTPLPSGPIQSPDKHFSERPTSHTNTHHPAPSIVHLQDQAPLCYIFR